MRKGKGGLRAWMGGIGILLALGAAGTAAAACKLGKLVELPVTMIDMKPIVTVKINGVDAKFVTDSGAFYSMITPASAAEFKLKTSPAPMGLTVVGLGGEAGVSVATVKVFTLAGVSIPNVEFLVGGGEAGGGSVGLLGQNVFRIGDVEYDLAHGVIRLMREEDCGKTNLAYWTSGTDIPVSVVEIQSTTPLSPHTMGTALLNGVKIRVMFDTGADTSFVTLHAAQRAGISVDAAGVKYAGMSRGIGRGTLKTWIAPVASFRLGDEEIRNTRLRIGEYVIESADMLIGADFFLSHRVFVASKHNKLFFTYNGGPVFNLSVSPAAVAARSDTARPDAERLDAAQPDTTRPDVTPPDAASPPDPAAATPAPPPDEPKDAAAYSRRGAAFAARREFVAAIADLTRACELAPDEPDYFYERGIAHAENSQPVAALSDLDRTLKLKPDHIPALVARAEIRIAEGDAPHAIEDLGAADRIASKEADARLRMAYAYARVDRLPQAIIQLDSWITAHGVDARLAAALNERCWARTLAEQDLPKALDDCNAALKMSDKKDIESARLFNSRGLVRLRLGDYQKSIADYDASIALRPKDAWALYGRGVDEKRLGQNPAAESDMAAASAIWPAVADAFVKRGIHP